MVFIEGVNIVGDAVNIEKGGIKMKRKYQASKKAKAVWTSEEDGELMAAVQKTQRERGEWSDDEEHSDDEEDWDSIAESLAAKKTISLSGEKTAVQCYKRYRQLKEKESTSPEEKQHEEGGVVESEAKKPRAEDSKWSDEEIELLDKLAEAYTKKHGKPIANVLHSFHLEV